MNRPFDQVTNDGQIYCYGPDLLRLEVSWLITMTGPSALNIRRVENRVSTTCTDPSSTWSMVGAVSMVR